MRVVLLNQYYAPDEAATAQLLADVGAALVVAGHDVVALCSDRSYADPSRRYPTEELADGVRILRARTSGFGRARTLGRLIDYATFFLGSGWRLLFRVRPDVVLSLTTPPMVGALGILASRLGGARSILWVMDVYPDLAFELGVLREGSAAGTLLHGISDRILRGTDRVIALDQAMAERLRARGAHDVTVVDNWADEATIDRKGIEGHPLRRAWGWEGRFVVLYSGNLGLAHEFETVLDAAERLRERSDVLLAFVGGGPRKAEVEAEVARRGLPNVVFRGYVPRDRLGESLTAGDVHLVTLRPRMPGLLVPSKIYGILAAGRPTIYVGPPDGGVATIVETGACGTRVANGDDEALARTVLAYADDEARRETEGRTARKLFEERFARRHGVGAIVGLIESLAEGAASSHGRRPGDASP